MARVLFISPQPFFQWRGSPIRVGFDVQALAELGFDVDLLTLPVGDDRDIPGVRIVRAPNLFRATQMPIGPSLLKVAFDVILFFMALGMAVRRRYAVIHCVEDAGPIGVLVASVVRSRLVYEKHSDPSSYKKGGLRNLVMALYARVERFTAHHADAVIGTGEGLVHQVRAMGVQTPASHIFDIPSSLTEASGREAVRVCERMGKGEGERLITFVGSFAVYQGVDLMFAAIPSVVRQRQDARFVVIGGTPQEIEEFRARLKADGAADQVTFLGKLPPDALPDYLAASDILLSPRLAGVNTPLKVLDYFKAGRAIVGTDTEANRLILDESTAVLVAPEPEAFAQAICRVLEDDTLRDDLGKRGRELYERYYNFVEFKSRLKVCYEALLGPDAEEQGHRDPVRKR